MKKKFIDAISLSILIFKGIVTGIFSFFTSFLLGKLFKIWKK